MAAIMLVFSVSPMLAPLAGSAMLVFFDWRAIFFALLIAASVQRGAAGLCPTRNPARRHSANAFIWATPCARHQRLLTDRGFLSLTFLGAFGFSSFFVFLASASFVYTESFGLTPTGFSLAFAANAIELHRARRRLAGPLGAAAWCVPADAAGEPSALPSLPAACSRWRCWGRLDLVVPSSSAWDLATPAWA